MSTQEKSKKYIYLHFVWYVLYRRKVSNLNHSEPLQRDIIYKKERNIVKIVFI